jgi:hypothetical protein
MEHHPDGVPTAQGQCLLYQALIEEHGGHVMLSVLCACFMLPKESLSGG